MKHGACFIVRAQFIGTRPDHIAGIAPGDGVYLGKRGQWCSLEKALRFKTRAAAEAALQEKWDRLRNDGNKAVILSVMHDDPAKRRGESAATQGRSG